MKAKFIYKSVRDVLRPKSQDEIKRDLSKLSKKKLDSKLIEASEIGLVDVVKLLLGLGANVEAKDDCNGTALIRASYSGCVEVVKLLVEAKANVNAKDNHGWTALMRASQCFHVEVIKLLLKAGADVDAKNDYGWTALMYDDVAKLLKKYGAKR